MDRFSVSSNIINSVLQKLKANEYISLNAEFNYAAETGLRSEVTYRDSDFLYFLGHTELEEIVVDELLNYLIENKIIHPNQAYNKEAFNQFREEIHHNFSGTWTSISPVMERVLYALTSLKKPKRLLELGSFWGNTLAWFAGPYIGASQHVKAEMIVGVDIDKKMCDQATLNFSKIRNATQVEIVNQDALEYVQSLERKIDFLYLEAKSEEHVDLYLKLLKHIEPKLDDNAWVIAHDIYDKDQMHDFDEYLNYVRDRENFKQSIAIDVDSCGLELSIK